MKALKQIAAAVMVLGVAAACWPARAETLKIASPIRGSWEGAVPELGQQHGIFQKYGLTLDILYTAGGIVLSRCSTSNPCTSSRAGQHNQAKSAALLSW